MKVASVLPNFELLFGVPPHHSLVLMRSRARGGLMRAEFWSHQEMDGSGAVVASYESYDEVDAHGQGRCGWRKYDASGCLVAQHSIPDSGLAHSNSQPRFAA